MEEEKPIRVTLDIAIETAYHLQNHIKEVYNNRHSGAPDYQTCIHCADILIKLDKIFKDEALRKRLQKMQTNKILKKADEYRKEHQGK